MADFPFDIVAFDLDGTLLETHRDLGTAVNHALTLGGFAKVPIESATDLIGGGAKIMLQRAVDAQGGCEAGRFHALYKAMLAHYGDHYADHTRPYPGAVEVFDALRARGAKIALVTNKFESFAHGVLTALGMDGHFDCIAGGDTLGRDSRGKSRAKPAPDLLWHARECCGGGSMVYVGDSSYDMKAARAAGVPVVAVTYGYGDAPPHELGADATVDSLDALVAVLETL